MQSILIFLLSAELKSSIYYSVGAHAATTLCASTAHYQVQISVPIVSFVLSTGRRTLANVCEDGSTIFRRKVLNFTPRIFSIPRLLPTSSEKIFCFCYSLRNILL